MRVARTVRLVSLALALPLCGLAATITVTTTADSGAGSLRDAITQSNASAGVLDTIAFNIPGTGVQTITIDSGLPIVTDPVVIDGTTQPGFVGSPLIELTPSGPLNGPRIDAGGTTIRGLNLHGFSANLQFLTNGGNVVEACYIGTDPTGTTGSAGNGITMQNSGDNRIGGTTPSSLNLISGMNGSGIQVISGNGTTIQGNLIGSDVTGLVALGNATGITIANSDDVTVGGTVAGLGNLVSGNTGVAITVSGSSNVLIAGNLIGVDISGTQAMPNNFGIDANNLSGPIVIGGTVPAARNIVSGNNLGIILNNGVGNGSIQGNFIGTDITGTLPVPNSLGILLNTLATTDILIGGTGPGEGNLIAFNQGVASNNHAIWNLGLRVTIRGNSIRDNQGIGIDNGGVGVDPNDPGDADGGANDGQNFPILTAAGAAARQGAGTHVTGVLRSLPSTAYTLDFYGNTGCTPRPQDFLEGETYLGEAQVTTDGSGVAAFDVTVPGEIAPGDFVSATATDPAGSTSEFSQRLPFSVFPTAGPASGGTPITITGTDFANGAVVTIGGQAASNVVVVGPTQITAQTPVLPAGTVKELTVANTDGTIGTLPSAWVSEFLDVPNFHPFYSFVTILVRNGITAGVGGGNFGVDQSTLRQQMAVFLLKAKYGVCYVPPPCAGIFTDVPCPSTFAAWIEDLAGQGITGGCGTGVYCPQNPVRRDQMAVFLLKTKHGSAYTPPPCAGTFPDVICPSPFADWIEQLAAEEITGGCGGGNYCPTNPNTRGQMAVFIVKTFSLQ